MLKYAQCPRDLTQVLRPKFGALAWSVYALSTSMRTVCCLHGVHRQLTFSLIGDKDIPELWLISGAQPQHGS